MAELRELLGRRRVAIDSSTLLIALALAALGVVAIYSATMASPDASLAVKQALWVGVGLVVLVLAASIDYHTWAELSPFIYVVTLVALVALLALGESIANTRAWLKLGPIRLQPSEFMKVATVLLLARLLAGYRRPRAGLYAFALAGAVTGVPMLLIVAQPDMGTAITFGAIFLVAIYLTGVTRKVVVVLAIAGCLAAVAGWSFVLKPYQKNRILSLVEPDADPLGIAYQTNQSKIAIGSGGLFGKGFGHDTQSRLDFLPEKHNDFIFPVVAEQWGFAGALVALGLYAALLLQLLRAAASARDRLGLYLAAGIMAFISAHIAINLGMVTGFMPTIGIPLPLMSYGGSSVISTFFAVGIVMNVGARPYQGR